MKREKLIRLIIYIALTIAGILVITLCRNYVTLNFVKEYCKTFVEAMIEWLKWLIIPCSFIAISFVTLIPTMFNLEKLSKILMFLEFLVLAGLAAYYTFYVNTHAGGFLAILDIIGYILDYIWILSWAVLIILIPLLIIKDNKESAIVSFVTIISSAFLMACAGHFLPRHRKSGSRHVGNNIKCSRGYCTDSYGN